MACEICGRSSCTRSFHSIEEQELHDKSEDELRDEIATLRAENEELKKDAARMEWLRKNVYVGVTIRSECLWTIKGLYDIDGRNFDAAIDAELAKGEP